ncbi:hypothetical protein ACX12E_12225 [Paenibacillus vandeheii]
MRIEIFNIWDYLFDYPEFKVQEIIPQRYPDQSSADFVILRRTPEIKNQNKAV